MKSFVVLFSCLMSCGSVAAQDGSSDVWNKILDDLPVISVDQEEPIDIDDRYFTTYDAKFTTYNAKLRQFEESLGSADIAAITSAKHGDSRNVIHAALLDIDACYESAVLAFEADRWNAAEKQFSAICEDEAKSRHHKTRIPQWLWR